MQNNQFEGIPSLDDQQGLENYMNNQALDRMGLNNNTPSMLQPDENVDNQNIQQQPQTQPTYSQDEINRIIAENNAYKAQLEQAQYQAQQPQQPQPTYTPQQLALIKQALDRGIPLDRINQALSQNRQQSQIMQKINNLEQYMAQKEYQVAQNQFVEKMQTFGAKFGLSESDLVTFANTALSKGINLINTPDVEIIFRSLYPDQYAIRMERIKATPSAIYGGGSIGQTPQENDKRIDAYVEYFLHQRMPNQYNKFKR